MPDFFFLLQAQAGWLQHDFGHLSVFKTSFWNHFTHQIILNVTKGAAAVWWNHLHYQHHAKPNVVSMQALSSHDLSASLSWPSSALGQIFYPSFLLNITFPMHYHKPQSCATLFPLSLNLLRLYHQQIFFYNHSCACSLGESSWLLFWRFAF